MYDFIKCKKESKSLHGVMTASIGIYVHTFCTVHAAHILYQVQLYMYF